MATIQHPYSPTEHRNRLSGAGSLTMPGRGRAVAKGSRKFPITPDGLTLGMTWFLMAVAAVAIGLSAYLSWAALTSSKLAGCGDGNFFNCSHVLQSKWSTLFGIPVGIPAAALYIAAISALATLVSNRKRSRSIALSIVTFASGAAGLAALWFIALQLFVVERFCGYCLAAHACGLIMAGAVLWLSPLGWRRTLKLSSASLLCVAGLVIGQLLSAPPATYKIEHHSNESVAGPQGVGGDSTGDTSIFSAPGFDSNSTNENDQETKTSSTPSNGDLKNGNSSRSGGRRAAYWQATFVHSTTFLVSASTSMYNGTQEAQSKPKSSADEKQTEPAAAPATTKSASDRRLIGVHGGKIQLDIKQWPLVGSPDAKYVFVEMFDYTCTFCRANHKSVKAAADQMGKEVAILALSVPLNSSCNSTIQSTDPKHKDACELSKLSVAVWRINSGEFAKFHEWLFSGDAPPTVAVAKAQAAELVGQDKLDAEMSKEVVGQYVAKQVELYQTLGAGTVPKMLFPGTTITGQVSSKDSLLQVIKQHPSTK